MTDLASCLSAFLYTHLPNERRLSSHTVAGYTDCFRLLVLYMSERYRVRPCDLKIEHFTVPHLLEFLDFLEQERGNSVSTRNVRLAAIKSFFRYVEHRLPHCLELALQVRAMPHKKADKPLIDWLEPAEMQAIVDAPDTATVAGLRDRAMLHLCYAAGLRVSELTELRLDSFSGPRLETVRIIGKGRRARDLPLWKQTSAVLREWLDVRPAVNSEFLFLNARGQGLSADGFAYILSKHVATAARSVPSLRGKRVTPHVVRHSTAMTILRSTRDIRKVSLWLGHADIRITEAYLRASPADKLEILEATTPPSIRAGKFPKAKDELMELLNGT